MRLDVPTNLWGDRIFLLLHGRLFLDWPHIFRTDAVGFPDGLDLFGFPFTDFTERLLQFLTTRLTGDVIVGANLYLILIVAANFAAAFWALRGFQIRAWWCLAGAFAFAFIPYFARRSTGHDYLAAYYAAPLAFLILPRIVTAVRDQSLARIAKDPVTLACCVIIATSGIYYSFFALLTWGFAGLALAAQERNWRYLPAMAFPAGLTLVVLVPILVFFAVVAPDNAGTARLAAEQPLYGFRISDVILRLQQLGVARNALQNYMAIRGTTEGVDAWPGPVLSVCALLAALFGAVMPRRRGPGARPDYEGLAPTFIAYLVFCMIYCAPFGLGLIFNLLIAPEIRAQNRIAPFFAFAALLVFFGLWRHAVLWLQSRLGRSIGGMTATVGLVALVLINSAGSQALFAGQQRALQRQPAFAAEMTSIRSALAAADAAGLQWILQLPTAPWPEAPPIRDFKPYDHFLPFIFSPPGSSRHWSYGALEGTDGLSRLEALVGIATWPCALAELSSSYNFDAVLIDRRAYDAGELAAWDSRLTAFGARLVNDDPVRRLYRLPTSGCSQPLLPLDRWLSAAAGGELEPLLHRGWYPPEPWGRWGMGATQRLLLPNRGLGGRSLVLDLRMMQLADKHGRIPRVEVRIDQTLIATISAARPMQPEEQRIVIPPTLLPQTGFTTIELTPEGGPIPASSVSPEDNRLLGVGLMALRVQEAGR
ncbi:hypothetical protein RFM68_09775 [Mesorhizobium sp. MSK_1335]|uniref:Uncharacterized protein n=1 Tax=Mesorhizobium montanum TaxID=3072323 RepID=A0ABU4ZIB8_9HYPH|nr:hypothetical protein [Mesorhizobium sp. MSK_1335]MDX8524797.1 hypothetical protein [Mesorhizobium sp. MSK_1335]